MRRLSTLLLVLVTSIALAACADERLTPLNVGPDAPRGVSRSADMSVDGLTVGHRLMEAGEYELAQKAYLRAAAEEGMTAEVLSSLGTVNLRLGRLGQAEDMLRRATQVDETYPEAWNNLGVVLMERGQVGEAARVFRLAFALDSGESAEIRENLRGALAQLQNPAYTSEQNENYELVRRGGGQYRIMSTP